MLRSAGRIGALVLVLLDLGIGAARKAAGFCALLALGWLYVRELVLGESLAAIFPGAADPDLTETLWVALLLILAQGWDVPADLIADHGRKLAEQMPQPSAQGRSTLATARDLVTPLVRLGEPVVTHLGRFMDLCVAVANKLGALAALVYLLVLAWQLTLAGRTVRSLYPGAPDPKVDLLADLCVYFVVLAWWATPFEQIARFWRRLRGRQVS